MSESPDRARYSAPSEQARRRRRKVTITLVGMGVVTSLTAAVIAAAVVAPKVKRPASAAESAELEHVVRQALSPVTEFDDPLFSETFCEKYRSEHPSDRIKPGSIDVTDVGEIQVRGSHARVPIEFVTNDEPMTGNIELIIEDDRWKVCPGTWW